VAEEETAKGGVHRCSEMDRPDVAARGRGRGHAAGFGGDEDGGGFQADGC
jgi:hypothetical protein